MALICTLIAVSLSGPIGSFDDALAGSLKTYFTAESASDRAEAEKKILAEKGLAVGKLAKVIRAVNLWEPQEAGERTITLRLRRGESSEKNVWVRVPEKYDPANAWPLVIAYHGSGGNGQGMLHLTKQLLANHADDFIIAAPDDWQSINLTDDTVTANRPRDLLVALRRQFHVNSDRVYLTGYSLGSHNAWIAAVMHPDCWAGVIPLATPLQIIENTLILPEVLANCRNTPILFVWGDQDNLMPDGKPHPQGGNTAMNRIMSRIIGGLGFEHYQAVELKGVGHGGVVPPPEEFSKILNGQREHYPRRIEHRYRLADQSVAFWVSSEKLSGEPLAATENIKLKEGEDPNVGKRRHLLGKLGTIEAKASGQKITLSGKRNTAIVLLLSDELVDLDKPVTIVRNKKELFNGKIPRDLSVMLREAARGWDFQRLPCARVVVPVGGKVRFGYAEGRKK